MTQSIRTVDEGIRLTWRLPNGRFHREDGPAIEWNNGDKEWWLDGFLHREDGPAIERPNGYESWHLNGKLHREDGLPAIIYPDGTKEWYLNETLHREDGPAVEYSDGIKYWSLNGVRYDDLSQITPELELKYPEFCKSFTIYQVMTQ
jgi:hypothetical protein